MSGVRVVLVTAPDAGVATELCQRLLEERLIACGNVVSGVRSLYRWEGRVEIDTEVLLVLKTTSERIPALVRRVPEIHPYDVPEVLALDVGAGHPPYLDWVAEETKATERDDA